MANYILVHGAFHGGWCWHRIVARLKRSSHSVVAPDLKSQGADRSSPNDVTLNDWVEQIVALAQNQPEPVVLVGHSRAGIVLSEVAERIPEQVSVLVYVTAHLLENGRSVQDVIGNDPNGPVNAALVVANDGQSVSVKDDAIRSLFYQECSDEDVELARSLLVPEPLAPLGTPVKVSAQRFGRVPRIYVQCSRDRAIEPKIQEQMQTALPCRSRIILEADHSPFFSACDDFASALAALR